VSGELSFSVFIKALLKSIEKGEADINTFYYLLIAIFIKVFLLMQAMLMFNNIKFNL